MSERIIINTLFILLKIASEKTRADWIFTSLSPLIFSMKWFGLYFEPDVETDMADGGVSRKIRGRNRCQKIYSACVTVVLWLNIIRMATIFTPGDQMGSALFWKLILFLWAVMCACLKRGHVLRESVWTFAGRSERYKSVREQRGVCSKKGGDHQWYLLVRARY